MESKFNSKKSINKFEITSFKQNSNLEAKSSWEKVLCYISIWMRSEYVGGKSLGMELLNGCLWPMRPKNENQGMSFDSWLLGFW